jgi:hypothetical protein
MKHKLQNIFGSIFIIALLYAIIILTLIFFSGCASKQPKYMGHKHPPSMIIRQHFKAK